MAKNDKSTEIASFKHQDKRVNIPPQELSAFMAEDERAPKTTLYPRDPSLDPQLVWKGKDEQDRADLAVPSVPIYIQEKIQPQAIIENVRAQAAKHTGIGEAQAAYQMDMFGDFNHIEFEDLVEFYEHEQNWSNRMILGDSLLVMNSLAQREALKGKVQMIYMDPPYGIKFGSNWQTRLRKRDVKDGAEADLTREPEQVKAFRDTWELGIHSYLSYLRDRFVVARDLLTESGSIFVQIGDENVHLVRNILDEVFGSENFVSQITFRKKLMPLGAKTLENMSDYLLWYAKDLSNVRYHQLFYETVPDPAARWTGIEENDGKRRILTREERKDISSVSSNSRIFATVPQIAPSFSEKSVYPYTFRGKTYNPSRGACWVTTKEKMDILSRADRLIVEADNPRYIMYHGDFAYTKITNPWTDTPPAQGKVYVVQTNEKVVTRCLLMTTDPGDLVLDPTCGSGTTAYVAEQWGRRWITIDTSRVSLALARMRLMSASYPYYLLADSPEGYQKELELSAPTEARMLGSRKASFGNDLRRGFVYERVPHITLKSIANNEEIDAIYERWQEKLEPLRRQINQALGKAYEEWEMPRETQGASNSLLQEWWQGRRARRAEIDASIARRADMELLYDKPYEDRKRVRVTGPFTVESLSPHRVLSSAAERPESEKLAERLEAGGKFEQMILENLREAGVQNTRKSERLNFIRLESYAGSYLQASGEYAAGGGSKRAAVCIGPEHGTVTGDLIREAAKEAMQGIGFDLLVVLGFAFDPHVSEEVKQYGKLKIFPARINPDLMMGDLLKKTKSANLFTAYGEPDVDLEKRDGKLVVRLKGVDIFDPTTGEIRSSKPEEIACWFIDDDYNEESFFVRQAYFTGWDDPYGKLKRTLRSEIDPDAWETIYKEESVAFESPKGGKIAVKVINDYGDEVMKVFEV